MILIHHAWGDFIALKKVINHELPYDYGVSFFFVLSGFVLAYVYRSMETTRDIASFFIHRIARIWPLHMVTLVMCLAVAPRSEWIWNGGDRFFISAANIFLLQAWTPIPAYYFSFNSVTWSISAEMFFYAMFPLLMLNFKWTWGWKALALLGVGLSLVLIADRMGLPSYSPEHFLDPTSHGIGYISPFTRVISFFVGIVAAQLYMNVNVYSSRITPLKGTLLEVVTLGVTLVWVLAMEAIASYWFGLTTDTALRVYLIQNGSSIFFALLILVFSFERGFITKILSVRPLVLLGEISFAMYMCHQIIIRWYRGHSGEFADVNETALTASYFLSVLVISFLLWRFVEKPCRNIIRTAFDRVLFHVARIKLS